MAEEILDDNETSSESEEVLEKSDKDNLLYWSLFFIAAVIILFLAGAKFYSDKPVEYNTITYNNWEFTEMMDMWWFEWQKGGNVYQVPLRFNPLEVENVTLYGKVDAEKFNKGKDIYITFNFSNESSQNLPMLALASTELTQNIASAINRTPVAACVEEGDDACLERPIKSCGNTDEPIIFLKEGGETAITMEGACITLTGKDVELVKAVDRLLYHWYRIIQT